MDNATSALARMNMVLHDCPTGEIWQANTLANPHFTNKEGGLRTFDFVLANPLPQLAEEVAALSAKVDEHLRKMGFAW